MPRPAEPAARSASRRPRIPSRLRAQDAAGLWQRAARTSLILGALWLGACSPEIGDKCSISTDCSVNGDRICDTAQPGGYCTVQGCDPDSCPNGAVCVEWRFEPSRTTATYCMERCRGGCGRSGYACVADDDPRLESNGTSLARVTDLGGRRDAKFCAAVTETSATSMSLVPTQSVMPDAAVPSP